MTYFAIGHHTPGITILKRQRGTFHKMCLICGNYFRVVSHGRKRRGPGIRSRKSKTCSPKCAKLYDYRNRYNIRQDLNIQKYYGKKMKHINKLKGGVK